MLWNEDLNRKQEIAASHIGSHARLLAGPGTGKTLTMTRRIMWLITEKRISPDQIQALTFTRSASFELRRNLRNVFEPLGIAIPRVATLHSFALRQILRNATSTTLPQPVRIADDYEERNIIIEEIGGIINKNVKETQELLNKLSADWQKLTAEAGNWERDFPCPQFLGTWREHRIIYGYTLRAELVYQLKKILQIHGAGVDLEGPPRYILIDEYQDLNACDLFIINSLAGLGCEIYVAGDDDQSIYGFRFASPEGIRRFLDEFRPSTDLDLEVCRRCRNEILEYGLFVARQDPRSIPKTIEPLNRLEHGEIHVFRFNNQNFEAAGIADLCSWLINVNGISPDEILILLRTDRNNQFSVPIKEKLTERGIQAAMASNPLTLLNHEQSREMLCLMRLVLNNSDNLAWRTVLSLNRGIGRITFNRLYELARINGTCLADQIQSVKRSPDLLERNGNKLSEAVNEIERFIVEIGIPNDSNLEAWITDLASRKIQDTDQRNSIVNLLLKIRQISDASSLEDLLRALNVSLGNAEQEKERGKVAIMTMHQAKGLSADVVIIPAAEDEHIPGRAVGAAIDDERRLLYVSLTRARQYLYITFCQRRTNQQRHSGRTAGQTNRTFTQFLRDGTYMPEEGQTFIAGLSSSL